MSKTFVFLLLYSQQPIDGNDDRDILGGQADRVQYHDHGHQASLRDASGTDRGRSCRDTEMIKTVFTCPSAFDIPLEILTSQPQSCQRSRGCASAGR